MSPEIAANLDFSFPPAPLKNHADEEASCDQAVVAFPSRQNATGKPILRQQIR